MTNAELLALSPASRQVGFALGCRLVVRRRFDNGELYAGKPVERPRSRGRDFDRGDAVHTAVMFVSEFAAAYLTLHLLAWAADLAFRR
jgi:hypothetical protein